MTENHSIKPDRWWNSKSGLVLLAFAAIAAFFLVTEHQAHVFGALPFIILLLCPLLHLFHGGHGGHDHKSEKDNKP